MDNTGDGPTVRPDVLADIRSYPVDWRDVFERVLTETEERMRCFW